MYFYHAYALGVASTIPGKESTEASCALSITGGQASATASLSKEPSVITFTSVDSRVSGERVIRNGFYSWVTEASVVIQNLNIQDIFTADRIEGHIVSEFRVGDCEANSVVTGKFDNVRIRGTPLHIEISEDLSNRYPTYRSLETAFQNPFSRRNVLACLVGRDIHAAEASSWDLGAAYEAYGEQSSLPSLKSPVTCSLVKKLNGGSFKTFGPIIVVPNFGNIYLGEVIVWPWMRCLNMFRVELSSGVSGGTLGVGTHGTDEPPPPRTRGGN